MAFDLEKIFERTDGRCHLCGLRLAFRNYGVSGSRGAWEVEHSIPRARGGTDHSNNLYAAHIDCNRSKGARSTRAVRAENGRTRAPLSTKKRDAARWENALLGFVGGAALGAKFGPPGVLVLGAIGAIIGRDVNTN